MFNVCRRCGEYRADKIVDASAHTAACPACGHEHPFLQLPLFVIGGASGAGKSAVCQKLTKLSGFVVLEGDILWDDNFADAATGGAQRFFESWLRIAKNISQSGRPVVLFNAGLGVPGNGEGCVERRYFSVVHYAALVCDDRLLTQRLRRRPAWRGSGAAAVLEQQVAFNQWLKSQGGEPTERDPESIPVELIDTTTTTTVEATAAEVARWLEKRMNQSPAAGPAG